MRYKITIEYDGTKLLGWQRQEDGPTAQGYLESALKAFAEKYIVIPEDKYYRIKADEPVLENEGTSTEGNLCTEHLGGADDSRPEDTSTGKLLQASNTYSKNGFSEKNGVDSTERNTGAYSNVREDVSTEKLLQASNKSVLKTIIQGAGRTDAGVHALSQVAHFDLNKDIEPFQIREAFNAQLYNLGAPVAVLEVEKVDDEFHARFTAKGRGYIYRILNRRAPSALLKNQVWWVPIPLNVEKMKQGAELLLGHHDFTSFRAAACQSLSPLKTLDKLEISTYGEEIIFTVEARSFLHHQVRNMVGTLKMIGDGHLNPEKIPAILEAKNRSAAGPTAPAHGLYLSKVVY